MYGPVEMQLQDISSSLTTDGWAFKNSATRPLPS